MYTYRQTDRQTDRQADTDRHRQTVLREKLIFESFRKISKKEFLLSKNSGTGVLL